MPHRIALACLLLAPLHAAADHVVGPGQSIQAAIDVAVAGDRVVVLPGTYFESLDLKGKAIELIGSGGASVTTVQGTVCGPVITLHAGEGPGTRIRGLTIRGGFPCGSGGSGGGIAGIPPGIGASATARVEDCVIRDNQAFRGGGVSGNLQMTRCVIADNVAGSFTPGGAGGGVFGAPVMKECAVLNNTVFKGGGGGLWATNSGPSLIEDCVFTGNTASNTGGGVYVGGAAPVAILRSVFTSNGLTYGCFGYCGPGSSPTQGSAVYAPTGANALVESCTVVDNLGQSTGGTATGGIHGGTVSDSILRGNTGFQVVNAAVTYCNVEGGAAGTGNFDADPLFVDAPGGDLHLRNGSPCIDTGTPTKTDPDGSIVDVGAFPFATLYSPRDPGIDQPPAWISMSAELGGTQPWRIHLGSQAAGHSYVILGSVSGTSPGVSAFGATLPLVPDWWFAFTLANPNSPTLVHTLGTLDATGTATAALVVPPGIASPVTAWHAALVLDPVSVQAVATNAVSIAVLP